MKLNWDRDYPRFLKFFFGIPIAILVGLAVYGWYQQDFGWPKFEYPDVRRAGILIVKLGLLFLVVKLLRLCFPNQVEALRKRRDEGSLREFAVRMLTLLIFMPVALTLLGLSPATLAQWIGLFIIAAVEQALEIFLKSENERAARENAEAPTPEQG